ncbi:putative serine/threonine protein kinase [Blattamonas nauphoetae]|uniref:Serine/threonine protein kinase n=1 Tax=Blattamonas nauphoetae TaxID=2049346 RepID=A0ABQ9X2W5_9EUKA|nr:putative serine/threonine protein kinase [Blattamonas nauphoetae]
MTNPKLASDNFDLIEVVGEGSFGRVYKARDKETFNIYGIKVIDLEEAEDEIEDIQKEIAILTECETKYITKYFGSFVQGSKLWIVMEFLEGGSCQELRSIGPFDEAQISVILHDTLLGLDYLHGQGKIHRDIKAGNILLAGNGDVKISDFGVSGQLTTSVAKRRTMVGTPFWMAPDVIQASDNDGYDTKCDIWSLGITAIELAKGVPPLFDLHPMKVLFLIPNNPPPSLDESDPEGKGDVPSKWSKEFRSFVSTCLVKDPKNRPTAKDLLKHKFIKNAKKNSILVPLVERKRKQRSDQPTFTRGLVNPFQGSPTKEKKLQGGKIAPEDRADTSNMPAWDFDDEEESEYEEEDEAEEAPKPAPPAPSRPPPQTPPTPQAVQKSPPRQPPHNTAATLPSQGTPHRDMSTLQKQGKTGFITPDSTTLPSGATPVFAREGRSTTTSAISDENPFALTSATAASSFPFTGTDDAVLLSTYILPAIRGIDTSRGDKKLADALRQLETALNELTQSKMGALSHLCTVVTRELVGDIDPAKRQTLLHLEKNETAGRIAITPNLQRHITSGEKQ